MNCTKTMFDRKILCAGGMTHYGVIVNHEASTTGIGDLQATPVQAVVRGYLGLLEKIRDTVRFAGVSIDRSSTHVFYIPFDLDVYELDVNKLFVLVKGRKERRFKLNKIGDYGEQEKWLVLSLEEKGFSENSANEA